MDEIIVLQNGRVIDPASGVDSTCDLLIKNGVLARPEAGLPAGSRYIELGGLWVVPGLIDLHVHLREPGQEYKETVASGSRAAAAGGITAVACMPNTMPVNDCGPVTRFICEKAASCDARVYPVGAVSTASKGRELADYAEMKAAGVVALTDDGLPVTNSQLMRRAMEYAKSCGLFIMSHAEELSLAGNGCMNEGALSTRMGLTGVPNAAEAVMVYRDIALAELTGCHVHFCHISTKESLELIRAAKARGAAVSAETAPHYFTLTEKAVEGYNTRAKMNPPLRSERDRQAVITALQDGTLDAIATDHAPHSELEKNLEFDQAANGIIGLETSLPLGLSLVHDRLLEPAELIRLMSVNPAKLLGVEGGSLAPGRPADITVIDPDREFVFREENIVSKGKNSPFLGWKLKGKAVMTILGGRIVHDEIGL
ncbi:MAG: dihydroorotase [Deltaproteobacteria bacterium]|nr:MAG: dihydroorotase [Deltaproteobacteria bacterium]